MKLDSKLTIIGITAATVVGIAAIAVPVIYQKRQARPQPEYVTTRYEGGDPILTFCNNSPVTPVAVTRFCFVVTKFPESRRIDSPKLVSEGIGSSNPVDNVAFTTGEWVPDGRYILSQPVGYHIEPNRVNDFRLAIIKPDWAGGRINGDVYMEYASNGPNGKSFALPPVPVTIEARAE